MKMSLNTIFNDWTTKATKKINPMKIQVFT